MFTPEIVSKEEWMPVAEGMHEDIFGDYKLDHAKNFDFTVLVTNDTKERVCYATVRELDGETAYLLYGGSFPEKRGQGTKGFHTIVEKLKEKYKHIGFAVRTNNHAMLKLGLNEKFDLVGLRQIDGVAHAELLLETGRI